MRRECRTVIQEDRGGVLLRAIVAGLAAAVAGGVVWGLIVKWSDYEVGFVAWGIGFLTGMAVLTFTGGRRGIPLQAIAIVCALLGILIGKYLSYAWVLQEIAEEETGGAVDISVFSGNTVDFFREDLSEVFGWIDLLCVALAVITAWRVLAPEEPDVAPEPEPEPAVGPSDRS
jgi:hypothetical protein